MSVNMVAIVANGSEDSELITCLDLIKRSGGTYKTVSLDSEFVTLSHGTIIKTDYLYKDLSKDFFNEFNCLFFPGGLKGVNRMKEVDSLDNLINDFYNSKRVVSAICAGPTVLAKAQILKNHKYTVYDGFENEIGNLENYIVKAPSVVSDNVITGRSVNYVIPFALDIIEKVDSKETRLKVEKQILM